MGLGVVWQPEGACLRPRVWLRAIRAAERGRDRGIGIAGKSAPKPAAAPRLRPPSASPVKTGFYMSPSSPTVPSFPKLPSALPWWHSVAKASCTPLLSLGSPVAHLFSAGLGIARPLPRPILSSLLKYSHSRFSSSGPHARTFITHQPFFSQLLTLS